MRIRLNRYACAFALCAGVMLPSPMCGQQSQTKGRDGQRDFDFHIGAWKTHVRRLQHPLTGSTAWVEYDGTTVVRKVWGGDANLVELDVTGPAGRIEGLSLRLYNPESRQWSLNFANSRGGVLSQPTIGDFRNGRGEFYDQETLDGRAILVRFVISDITPDSARFEQSFSDDGGKTWETNWIATDTRVKAGADPVAQPENSDRGKAEAGPDQNGQHGFDFELGSWKLHLHRLVHPLTNSNEWVDFDGTSVTRKVWGGRANLEEFDTEDPVGHTRIQGLTLRLFNPESRQWSLYWANKRNGTLGVPTVGQFENGKGEFFDQEIFKGRTILVRYVWSNIASSSPHFEQSFSVDGGRTWEPNWITDQTRSGSNP